MNKQINDIREFNEKFGLDEFCFENPQFLNEELAKFRIKFMLEELQEFANACGCVITGNQVHYDSNNRKDMERALDGLVDLDYVLKGTVVMMGLHKIYDEAWQRVQNANMAKVRAKHASESKRGSTVDVIKPEGWQSPTFKDLLA